VQTLRDIAPYVALVAAVLAVVLLVLVILLWTSVRRLRRAQVVVMGRHGERDLVAHADSLDSQVRNLREAVEILTDQLDDQKRQLDHALTNRAIVRYDAFRDAGGEQSASFALLDQYRSGVVFSAIAARDFARIYVKHVYEGVADRDLSPEEQQAVALAVPQPLTPGAEGPRAARAPLPEPQAPWARQTIADGGSHGETASDETVADDAAGGLPAAEGGAAAAPHAGAAPQAPAELEPEATFAPGPAEPAEGGDAAVTAGEAAGGTDAGETGTPPPLQPLLDDDAFTWEERPARPAPGGPVAPDGAGGETGADAADAPGRDA
jgi:hypothetical protein